MIEHWSSAAAEHAFRVEPGDELSELGIVDRCGFRMKLLECASELVGVARGRSIGDRLADGALEACRARGPFLFAQAAMLVLLTAATRAGCVAGLR